MKSKLSIHLSCRLEFIPGSKLSEKLENAAAFGFDAVSFPGRMFASFREELVKLEYSPVDFASLSLGFQGSLLSPYSDVRRKCRQSLFELIDFCSEHKIAILNVPPILNQDNPVRYNEPGPFKSLRERFDYLLLKQLPELGDYAQSRNVVLVIEPVNRYESEYLHSIKHATELCIKMNHPSIGLTADFFHMQIEELNIYESLLTAGKYLKHVHVAENTRVEPGPGSLDFSSGFAALHEIGFNGFIEIECRSLSGAASIVLPETVRYIKSQLQKAHSKIKLVDQA